MTCALLAEIRQKKQNFDDENEILKKKRNKIHNKFLNCPHLETHERRETKKKRGGCKKN